MSNVNDHPSPVNRSPIPFLVGGSVMWIDAVVENYEFPEEAFNPQVRESVAKFSIDEQLSELQTLDPESHAHLVREKNPRYISRALEIIRATGKPKSAFKKGPRKFDVLKIAIDRPRDELYQRINTRVHSQLERGLIAEVMLLAKKYLANEFLENWELKIENSLPPAFTSIGVKEVLPYLSGQTTKEEMVQKLQQASRNYAKRQLTWLRKDPEVQWVRL